jgi:hypothetical protein
MRPETPEVWPERQRISWIWLLVPCSRRSHASAEARRGPGGAQRTSTSAVRSSAPLWILAITALAFFLRETRQLFVPVALALLASYVFYPLFRSFNRRGLPRALSHGRVDEPAVLVMGLGRLGLHSCHPADHHGQKR